MDDDTVEWIRQQEQSTKNIMMKKNRKRRGDAYRRAPEDLSVHIWAQTMPGPKDGMTDLPIDRASESAPSRLGGRKRPLSSSGGGAGRDDATIAGGTRSVANLDRGQTLHFHVL
jgi:hypothetical protein